MIAGTNSLGIDPPKGRFELEVFARVFGQPFSIGRSDLELDVGEFTTATGLFLILRGG